MKYKVIKSSYAGISGGEASYASIKDVLGEIVCHKGWDTLQELHNSIKKWSQKARPGDVYRTLVEAIVAVASDADDFDPVEVGGIEQLVKCPSCGEQWRAARGAGEKLTKFHSDT